LDCSTDQQIHERVFVFEVREECAFGHAGARHDLFYAQGFVAVFSDQILGSLDEAGAGFDCSFLDGFCHDSVFTFFVTMVK